MDGDIEGVKLIQQVLLGLTLAKVPMREALTELGAVLAEPEAVADLHGCLRAWRATVTGAVGPDSRAGWPVPTGAPSVRGVGGPLVPFSELTPTQRRNGTALRMARSDGAVTSSLLALACGCSVESARVCLRRLADDGHLVPVGDKRGRRYTLRAAS